MDLIIVRELLKDLPADRGMALIEICSRVTARLRLEQSPDLTEHDCFQLAKTIERFSERYGLLGNLLEKQPDETWNGQLAYLLKKIEEFEPVYIENKLASDIDLILGEADEDLKKNTKLGEAVLSPEDKIKIHRHLQAVREHIEKSSIPENKKTALLNRLNELATEVDRYGTASDRFFGFMVELSFAAKKFHENLKPAINDMQEALRTIYLRKAKNEGVALPEPEELPQLPTPDDFE